jgi:outer membrane protein assembly factor BamB
LLRLPSLCTFSVVLTQRTRKCLILFHYGVRIFACCCVLSFLIEPSVGRAQQSTITNDWAVEIGCLSDSSPAIGLDGTIYFGDFLGRLWALSAEGKRKWVFGTGLEIISSPAIGADGTIYCGSRDRNLYALRPNGTKLWSFETGGWVDSSPAIADDGTIVFGSWDGTFYALNPAGSKKWGFQTGAAIVSSAAIDRQGRIYFGSHDRKLYAIEADGKKAWEFSTSGPILSSPALDEAGNIYFTSVDGSLYALKPDGVLRWRLRTGGITGASPVIGLEETVYIGVNKQVWAVGCDGKKQWERLATSDEYQQPIEASPVALADRSLGVVSGYGLLIDFDLEWRPNWAFYLYGHGYATPAVGASGSVYIAGAYKQFFSIPAKVPLAKTTWPKFRANPRNTGNVAGM